MKFSESWLRTLVDPKLSSEELSHLLTMAGLEVEELDPVAPQFNDVVVAQVLEVDQAPRCRPAQCLQGRYRPRRADDRSSAARRMSPSACACRAPCPAPACPAISSSRSPRCVASSPPACFVRPRSSALPKRRPACWFCRPMRRSASRSASTLISTINLFTLKLTPNRADCLSLTGIAREVAAIDRCAGQSVQTCRKLPRQSPTSARWCSMPLPPARCTRPHPARRQCQGADAGVDEAPSRA